MTFSRLYTDSSVPGTAVKGSLHTCTHSRTHTCSLSYIHAHSHSHMHTCLLVIFVSHTHTLSQLELYLSWTH